MEFKSRFIERVVEKTTCEEPSAVYPIKEKLVRLAKDCYIEIVPGKLKEKGDEEVLFRDIQEEFYLLYERGWVRISGNSGESLTAIAPKYRVHRKHLADYAKRIKDVLKDVKI